VICSDKTGTLTKDEMTVQRIYAGGQLFHVSGAGYIPEGSFSVNGGAPVSPTTPLREMLAAASLASDTRLEKNDHGSNNGWDIKGDPTEGALVVAAAKAGLQKDSLDIATPRVHEIPFTSESKRMVTFHRDLGGLTAYAKGAPEVLLEICDFVLTENGVVALDSKEKRLILAHAQEMAGEALRVLAVARKPGATPESAEKGMTFLGLAGMIDPPRPEVKTAIA
jgi:Ca2+-transporting ATPase